jgi:hypothetical protein
MRWPQRCVQWARIKLLCFFVSAMLVAGIGAAIVSAPAMAAGVEPATIVLPSALPLQRASDASLAAGNVSGALVVGLILLAALLFYVRVIPKRRRHGKARQSRKITSTRTHAAHGLASGYAWTKWLTNSTEDDEIRVVATKVLSPASRLHVIEWNGNAYLLAQSEQAFILLDKAAGNKIGGSTDADGGVNAAMVKGNEAMP